MKLLIPVTILCVLISCNARPDGAPMSACYSLTPGHSGISPQNSRTPYVVTVAKDGDKVKVTISSPIAEVFEGFMLQARSSKDPSKFIDGEFTSSEVSKTTDCFNGTKNTLTHASATPKKEVETEWTPTGALNEDIIFRATVAKDFAVFWTEVDSSPVTIKMSDNVTENMENEWHAEYICSNSRGCFGIPMGCVATNDCQVLLTFEKTAGGIEFGLLGYIESSRYMAMALSDDAIMGEDTVTECIRDGSNVLVRESWNEGKSNTRTTDLPRNSYNTTTKNGVTACYWRTPYRKEVNGQVYDLANKNYYVLLAEGEVANGRLNYHSMRVASNTPINFTHYGDYEVPISVEIHSLDETTMQHLPATDEPEDQSTSKTSHPVTDHVNSTSQISVINFSLLLVIVKLLSYLREVHL